MSRPEQLRYPVPWDLVFGLTSNLRRGEATSVDRFSAGIVARMNPPPVYRGFENLPASPRFVLAANHYQRKGLWILHAAAVLTQAIRQHYGPSDPPVRWIVTANWPPLRLGPWRLPSPGDWLLPRVAHVLQCYPVSFAAHNPGFTARSIRRVLREAPKLARPIGIFPEGVAGSAGRLATPLPGVGRLLAHLAKLGLPVVPVTISEAQGRFLINFRQIISTELLTSTGPDPAILVMDRIQQSTGERSELHSRRVGGHPAGVD
jgi:hypothetical protein